MRENLARPKWSPISRGQFPAAPSRMSLPPGPPRRKRRPPSPSSQRHERRSPPPTAVAADQQPASVRGAPPPSHTAAGDRRSVGGAAGVAPCPAAGAGARLVPTGKDAADGRAVGDARWSVDFITEREVSDRRAASTADTVDVVSVSPA